MTNNRAFWKALHSLTHPLSIASTLLLLFNDHWLRHNYPSWLTGKLGDFTWLLFAPFITALLIALLIPKNRQHQTKIVGLLSIGFIGIWFTTAKTVPFVHWLTTETLYNIIGYRGTLRLDVTDLLTLPALLFSWRIWRQSAETSINLKPIGYVAFGLGILVTMASDDPQYNNTAIERICEFDDGILVTQYSYYSASYDYETSYNERYSSETFISNNGGLQWRPYYGALPDENCSDPFTLTATNPNNNDIAYRWFKDDYIEQSTDAGTTWLRIHDLDELNQDVREYGNQNPYFDPYDTEVEYLPSPVSGVVHSGTGNLVLAMSRDGVLVIEPDNTSHWVAVGEFQLDSLQDMTLISDAFAVHRFLLPTLWFLILVTTVTFIHAERVITRLWLTIGWMHWLVLVIFAHKVLDIASGSGYSGAEGDIALFWGLSALVSLIIIAIPMTLWSLLTLVSYYGRTIKQIMITVILASMVYLLPLALWTQGTIPRYYMASLFSLLLVACVLWACYQQFKDTLPAKHIPEKAKRKQKEI